MLKKSQPIIKRCKTKLQKNKLYNNNYRKLVENYENSLKTMKN